MYTKFHTIFVLLFIWSPVLLVEIFGHWMVGKQDLLIFGAGEVEHIFLVRFVQVLCQAF